CSLPLWFRHRLTPWAARVGLRSDPGPETAGHARRLLVIGTVLPVLILTLIPVGFAFAHSGERYPGPEAGSIFLGLGRLASNVIPLFMVCVGLIIHALRERLPGYAFVVGLGTNVMVSLIVRSLHRKEGVGDWYVVLLQLNAVAFAATALLWLSARKRLYGERGTGTLLVVQLGLGVIANALLLAAGLVFLVVDPGSPVAAVAQVGEAWGWVALLLTAGACGWYAVALG